MKVRELLLIAVLGGCAQTSLSAPVLRPMDSRVDPTEYAAFEVEGASEIQGQAFLTTRGGDVKVAAGRLVTLDPATSYAKEWFRRFGADVSTFDATPPAPAFQEARRITTADADGRFRFTGLPPGEYLVRTTVTWETGNRFDGLQGGVVAKLVRVGSSGRVEPILNEVYSPDVAAMLGVEIIPRDRLIGRDFVVLREVEGLDCQVGMIEQAPTEEDAQRELVLNAARAGGNAVTDVVCEPRGLSLIPNCTRRVVCVGNAIVLQM